MLAYFVRVAYYVGLFMKQNVVAASCGELVFGLCLALPAIGLAEGADPFPLVKGNYWVYRGLTRWTPENSHEVRENVITCRMEVVNTLRKGNLRAAVLKGHPQDLAWYQDGKEAGDYLIVRVGAERFYLYTYSMNKVVAALRESGPGAKSTVPEDPQSLFLDLPLKLWKRFGEPEMVERPDGWYCWVVEEITRRHFADVAGIPPEKQWTEFQLALRSLPDHQIVNFVPGIGITRYRYAHHGTVSQADVHLVEFHPAR